MKKLFSKLPGSAHILNFPIALKQISTICHNYLRVTLGDRQLDSVSHMLLIRDQSKAVLLTLSPCSHSVRCLVNQFPL